MRYVPFKEFDIDKSKLCTNNELDTLKLLLNPRNRVQTTQVSTYLSSAIQMREQKNTKAISKNLIKQKNQFCMLIQASMQFLIILSKIQSCAPLSFNACIPKLIHVYLKAISKNPIKQKIKNQFCMLIQAIMQFLIILNACIKRMYRFFFESVYIKD